MILRKNIDSTIKPAFLAVITAKSPMPVFGGRNDDDFPTFPASKFSMHYYRRYFFGMFPI